MSCLNPMPGGWKRPVGKNIQIPRSLYDAMVDYIHCHFDPCDRERYKWICNGISLKESNMIRHNLFSAYKAEKDPETTEMLRQAYLDETGIPSHGRWEAQTDIAIRNGDII